MTAATTRNEIDPAGVDHPIHYNTHPSGVECIDLVRHMSFDPGNSVKYVFRAGLKDDPIKDLRKAYWYLRDYLYSKSSNGERIRMSPQDRPPMFFDGAKFWQWDELIAHEPDLDRRKYYLAIRRDDPVVAHQVLDDIIRANGGHGDE